MRFVIRRLETICRAVNTREDKERTARRVPDKLRPLSNSRLRVHSVIDQMDRRARQRPDCWLLSLALSMGLWRCLITEEDSRSEDLKSSALGPPLAR